MLQKFITLLKHRVAELEDQLEKEGKDLEDWAGGAMNVVDAELQALLAKLRDL